MRRLRDLPGIADLEAKSWLHPELSAQSVNDEDLNDWLQNVVRGLFGVSRHDIWEAIAETEAPDPQAAAREFMAAYLAEPQVQIGQFAALGWDVTDEQGRELRTAAHLSIPLMAAIRSEWGRPACLNRTRKPGARAWRRTPPGGPASESTCRTHRPLWPLA